MLRDVGFVMFLTVVDVWFVYSLREVLYGFLMGSCRKDKYRAVRSVRRPFMQRLTLSFIRACIKEEGERASFDRYRRYYIGSMIAVPVKLAVSLVWSIAASGFSLPLLAVWVLSFLIHAYVLRHEGSPAAKRTVHAGKKYRKH